MADEVDLGSCCMGERKEGKAWGGGDFKLRDTVLQGDRE